MKTATLPSAKNGHNRTCTRVFNGVADTGSPQLVSLVIRRANRYLLFVGMLLTMMLGFIQQSSGQGTATFNFTTTGAEQSFTVPSGVTSIRVECWAGGGAGGGVTDNPRAGGGGEGGSFVRGTISVSPGAVYNLIVGNGGIGSIGNGTTGGASSFGGSGLFNAIGGVGGSAGTNFGSGGNASNTGNIASGTVTSDTYGGNGGDGTSASTATSGGGGGSAGAGSDGGAGGTPTAGTAGAAGSPSAPGANGAAGRGASSDGAGNAGNVPGGGGSGGRNGNNSTDYIGGNGGNGRVIVSWTNVTVTGFSPTAACTGSGQSVSITGTNFTGATSVTFNGVSSSFTVNSATQVTATLPSGATTGRIIVTTPSGFGTSSTDFTVSSPVAVILGQTNISCFAANDGTINVSASGGIGPYTFSNDDGATFFPAGGANQWLFEHLSPDTPYRIRVMDFNGCISR